MDSVAEPPLTGLSVDNFVISNSVRGQFFNSNSLKEMERGPDWKQKIINQKLAPPEHKPEDRKLGQVADVKFTDYDPLDTTCFLQASNHNMGAYVWSKPGQYMSYLDTSEG